MSNGLQLFQALTTDAVMYDANFTKKEATEAGVNLVNTILEEGNITKVDFLANVVRMAEVLNSSITEMKKHLPQEKVVHNGVEFNYVQGGELPQYAEDPIYAGLQKALKAREALLKSALAQDEPIFTEEGEVPKVSTKSRASSITCKF